MYSATLTGRHTDDVEARRTIFDYESVAEDDSETGGTTAKGISRMTHKPEASLRNINRNLTFFCDSRIHRMNALSQTVRYGILLLKAGGLKVFFHELGRHCYSRASFVGFELSLDAGIEQCQSKVEYSLRLASQEDIEEVLREAGREKTEPTAELIQHCVLSKVFHEAGFRNCYVARTTDTNELCHVKWLVSPGADDIASGRLKGRLSGLKADEILIENSYTFQKYRGNGIAPSATAKLCAKARGNHFKRAITYIRQDNVASLNASKKIGFRRFGEMHELKLLFFSRKRYG
jgi:L-amino acid N-acyltransferase YncA